MQLTLKNIISIVIALFFLLMFFLYMAMKEGNTCIENPLTYGAEKLSTEETGDVTCTCHFSNPRYEPFFFDKNNVSLGLK